MQIISNSILFLLAHVPVMFSVHYILSCPEFVMDFTNLLWFYTCWTQQGMCLGVPVRLVPFFPPVWKFEPHFIHHVIRCPNIVVPAGIPSGLFWNLHKMNISPETFSISKNRFGSSGDHCNLNNKPEQHSGWTVRLSAGIWFYLFIYFILFFFGRIPQTSRIPHTIFFSILIVIEKKKSRTMSVSEESAWTRTTHCLWCDTSCQGAP